MLADSAYFLGHRCFRSEFVGFDRILPINIVIGRNNSGKSHVLDLAELLCTDNDHKKHCWQCRITGVMDEGSVRAVFSEHNSGGELGGNHWGGHGVLFKDKQVTATFDESGAVSNIELPADFDHMDTNPTVISARMGMLEGVVGRWTHELNGLSFRRLNAERNVQSESPNTELSLSPHGVGATNIVRRYLISSSLNRDLIRVTLLHDLNTIFGSDGHFEEIQVREHDEASAGFTTGNWEIYLGEKEKGLVPLSWSGSGLKTVFLVLLNLLVIPEITKTPRNRFTFALEELENNLHPALLRRLLRYIENYSEKEKATFFLTTHSSVALDVFGMSSQAQIVHVTHNGTSATARAAELHLDRLSVVAELGAKPSDLLQANCVIWVEGPSDRIYVNAWIEIFSDGTLKEGRDYQCAFYGGSLLARLQVATAEDEVGDLVNLFRLNANIIVMCDSDKSADIGEGSELKERVKRISNEIAKIPNAHMWLTDGKEIENYLTGFLIGKALGLEGVRDPGRYERFFPSIATDSERDSFVEDALKRKTIDKVDLALKVIPHLDKSQIRDRFGLEHQIQTIIERIQGWNL